MSPILTQSEQRSICFNYFKKCKGLEGLPIMWMSQAGNIMMNKRRLKHSNLKVSLFIVVCTRRSSCALHNVICDVVGLGLLLRLCLKGKPHKTLIPPPEKVSFA